MAIAEVAAGSAAAEAGLRVGDVILRIGRDGIRAARDVAAAIKAYPGDVIPVLVRRSGYDFWSALRRYPLARARGGLRPPFRNPPERDKSRAGSVGRKSPRGGAALQSAWEEGGTSSPFRNPRNATRAGD